MPPDSILPPNASALERDIEAAVISRFLLLSASRARYLFNPDLCPAHILPWLAWAVSVDLWNENWTTERKRAVIRGAVCVHQSKGTIGALRTAIQGYNGMNIRVEEWFQYGGDPFKFRVIAEILTSGISNLNEVEQSILATKNLRSHLERLSFLMTANGETFVGVAVGAYELLKVE